LEEVAIQTMLDWYEEQGMLATLDTDVYVVGHHGSHNGTTDSLLAAVTPEIAVISAGPSTRRADWSAWQYGHPRRVTVERLDGVIDRQRAQIRDVRVADAQWRFSAYRMRNAIYATPWDGDIVISARADGALRVSSSR
jgi:competence protein ComEC